MRRQSKAIPLPPTAGWLLSNSNYDLLPIAGGLLNLALIFWSCLAFAHLPWWGIAVAFVSVALMYCWNLQCVAHNLIHNPFFTSDWLNRVFYLVETLCLGAPHILNHHYHVAHHIGDNDYKRPDGTTKDWSSIYRYGEGNQPESFWRYSLIGYFRAEIVLAMKKVIRHGWPQIAEVIVEFLAIGAMWLFMLLYNWKYFVYFYLPSYYIGWVLIYAEGYLEHYGAQPGNNFANSVSCYNWLYNFLTFNNGYHQEHHWDPKAHWTAQKQIYKEIEPQLAANKTRILRGPHITALIEDWWDQRQRHNKLGDKQTRSQTAA
jgi:fatty acid desaturase